MVPLPRLVPNALLLLVAGSTNLQMSFADTVPDVQKIYGQLSSTIPSDRDYKNSSENCFNRADVWTYELELLTQQPVSKALILSTLDVRVNNWVYHIAPVLRLGEAWVVFEKANGIQAPMEVTAWVRELNQGKECDLLTEVPLGVYDAVSPHTFNYDFTKRHGNCMLFIVGAETREFSDGFLGFKPNPGAPPLQPVDRDRAIRACVGMNPNRKKEEFCVRELDSYLR